MSEYMPFKILIINSDKSGSAYLSQIIERYWFNTTQVTSFMVAKNYILLEPYHLIIVIDNNIDQNNLWEFFQFVRKKKSNLSFIFLLKNKSLLNSTIYSKIKMNNLIQFLEGSFDSNELMVTIKNLIKSSKISSEKRTITYKTLKIDLLSYNICYGDYFFPRLGKKEHKILEFFIKNPQKIIDKEQLRMFAWGEDNSTNSRTCDVYINKIRKILNKFSQQLSEEQRVKIITLRSLGYSLI